MYRWSRWFTLIYLLKMMDFPVRKRLVSLAEMITCWRLRWIPSAPGLEALCDLFVGKNLKSHGQYWFIIITGWWFQTFVMFHNIWDNPSHWLSLYFSEGLKPPTRLSFIIPIWLVVWNQGFLWLSIQLGFFYGNVIIPTDELHHSSEG